MICECMFRTIVDGTPYWQKGQVQSFGPELVTLQYYNPFSTPNPFVFKDVPREDVIFIDYKISHKA